MSRSRSTPRGPYFSSVGVFAVILYFVDKTIAQYPDSGPGGDRQQYPDSGPGNTGGDYPEYYSEVPKGLSFTCDDKIPGYYADPETQCQVWHWCVPGLGGNRMYSFICGPGTVFNQQTRVCDFTFKVDCQNSAAFYSINEDLYKDAAGNFIVGSKDNSYNTEYDRRRVEARRKRMENTEKKHTKRDTNVQNATKRNIRDRGSRKFRSKYIKSVDF